MKKLTLILILALVCWKVVLPSLHTHHGKAHKVARKAKGKAHKVAKDQGTMVVSLSNPEAVIGDIVGEIAGNAGDNVAKGVNETIAKMGNDAVEGASRNADKELHKVADGMMDSVVADLNGQIAAKMPFNGR